LVEYRNEALKTMKLLSVFVAATALTGLVAGCQSHSKHGHKEAKVVAHCSKAADPSDTTLLVIQWKRHTSAGSLHDLSYYTFRYTPNSDEPCSYETVAGLICERYVTSEEATLTNCPFAGKHEVITKIVIDADKIVHPGTSAPASKDTSDCFCPKR